jgi:hypothetical protein
LFNKIFRNNYVLYFCRLKRDFLPLIEVAAWQSGFVRAFDQTSDKRSLIGFRGAKNQAPTLTKSRKWQPSKKN